MIVTCYVLVAQPQSAEGGIYGAKLAHGYLLLLHLKKKKGGKTPRNTAKVE